MPFKSTLFQRRSAFGRIDEEVDDDFHDIRTRPFAQNARKLANLDGNVGRSEINNRRDVAKVETILARENRFDITRTDGPTGIFSIGLEGAIKNFQDDNGLKKDGLITPRGETISSMINISILDSEGGEAGDGGDEAPEGPPEAPPENPENPEDGRPDGKPVPPIPEPKPDPPDKPKDPDDGCEEHNAQIQAQIDQVQSEIDVLESQKAPIEAEIAALQSELEPLEAEKATLEANLDGAKDEVIRDIMPSLDGLPDGEGGGSPPLENPDINPGEIINNQGK